MKKIVLFLLLLSRCFGRSEYSIAFVHIADAIPGYVFTTLKQARYMNDACDIYFFVNRVAERDLLQNQSAFLKENAITLVNVETLPLTKEHQAYRRANKFNDTWRDGFWNHVTERFFYLADHMVHAKIYDLIQIESDVMLYADLSELTPSLKRLVQNVAAPFEWRSRCIASFVYFKNPESAVQLARHILSELLHHNANDAMHANDMCTLASFMEKGGEEMMTPLPILMPEFALYHARKPIFRENGMDNESTTLEFISKYYNYFPGYIFDAAALGIYIKGYDRRNGNYSFGAIHPKSVFDPSKFHYYWGQDPKGRIVPCISFKGKDYRIVDLHFHSKLPEEYTSFGDYRAELPDLVCF